MPIPIKFGTKQINDPDHTPKTTTDKDGKESTEPHRQISVDNIINNPDPAWTKTPTDLKDEDYKDFYRELYPMQFEEPLFNIHLNVDYPFNLTGILYFPKISNDMNIQKDRIQLYQNQVFVTDNVEGIVPEFLTMLRGVIDSPDIKKPENWNVKLESYPPVNKKPLNSLRKKQEVLEKKKFINITDTPTGETKPFQNGFTMIIFFILLLLIPLLSGCVKVENTLDLSEPDLSLIHI